MKFKEFDHCYCFLHNFYSSPRRAVTSCALSALSESLFYTALAPQLLNLDQSLGLSHQSAGYLAAGYSLGYWLGVSPAYLLLIRKSARAAACIAGLLVTLASIVFAYGDSFAALFLSRIIAGFGSVVMYSAVLGIAEGALGTKNKGSAVGTVDAGAAAGSSVGPVLGGMAQLCVALMLAAIPARDLKPHLSLQRLRRCLCDGMVWTGLWVTSVRGFAIGVLTISGTYQLHQLGAQSWLVALTFSGIALLNIRLSPIIGRLIDRIGRRAPALSALASAGFAHLFMISVQTTISTVVLIAVAGALLLAIGGPGLVMVNDGVEHQGGGSNEATLLMNFCWGPTAALGAISAGLVHSQSGAEASFLALIVITVMSCVLIAKRIQPLPVKREINS